MLWLSLLQLSLGVWRLMMSNLTNRDYIEYRDILSAILSWIKINQYRPSLVHLNKRLQLKYFIVVCFQTLDFKNAAEVSNSIKIILNEKLPLSQKLCHFRGSRFSQCFILSTASPLLVTKAVFMLTIILSNYQ